MQDERAKRVPENTTRLVAERRIIGLAGALPGGIEALESAGQANVCASDTLPAEGSDHTAFVAFGWRWGDRVPGDDLFRFVELPDGWGKRPTAHAMWNEVTDARGRVRAHFFYKAAPYDRRAQIHVVPRFEVEQTSEESLRGNFAPIRSHEFARVIDHANGDAQPFRTQTIIVGRSNGPAWGEVCGRLRAEAVGWLDQHYPDWHDPAAYWD